ncbi:FxDxF family PEP-CTERM protein [Nitrosomonas sp. wSCUT-2]
MKTKMIANLSMLAFVGAASSAYAGGAPDSYDMLNGNTGSYNYWDETYNGSGCVTCDNAALSGGRGDLTDGIIATENWFITEAPVGNGPYVGWTIDPVITFHWNTPVNITSVTFHFDDSNGAGGVSAPASVTVGGTNFAIADPIGSAPFAFVADGLSFSGNDLVVSIARNNAWVFLSEVEFNAAPIPEPETYAMLLAGLGLLGFVTRRRKAMAA